MQQRIAPVVNKAKSVLESSKLIAVRHGKDRVYCKFIPKNSTNTRTKVCETTQIVTLNYSCGGVEYEEKVGMRIKDYDIEMWDVISNIKVIVAGDLCFFATCTGRDGRSHCCFTYCESSPIIWSQHNPPTCNKLTKDMLIKYGNQYIACTSKTKPDTKGIIMPPLFDCHPQDYIVPVLHLMIGITNKGWTSLLHFLDEFVENVSIEECEMRDKNLK